MHSLRAASEKRDLGGVRRVVVKVGSAVIAGKGRLRPKILSIVARDVTALQNRGCEVVMVVSGAVAAGYRPLGMHRMPTAVVERQSAASVGQHLLMATISTLFEKHRVHVAQLLMSAEDIENRRRFLSARHTLQMLISRGIVPVINENDRQGWNRTPSGSTAGWRRCSPTSVYIADVLISMGCLSSQRLKTLKQIMPASMGNWLRKAAGPEPNRRRDVLWATHRL